MRILFLGDVVGISGCSMIMNNLIEQVKIHKIDFVIVNAENADKTGVGLTEDICKDLFFEPNKLATCETALLNSTISLSDALLLKSSKSVYAPLGITKTWTFFCGLMS